MNESALKLLTIACCLRALLGTAPVEAALEEVIVTAQKRAEGLQDAPLSIAALTGTDVARLKMHGITDLAGQVPNVTVSTPYAQSQPSFSIRGVSMSDFSQNQSSPIAMYVDEVYKGVGALQALQLFDVERIEVLRGPQGTLYGKNATGGAVNIITHSPDLSGANTSYLTAGVGSFDQLDTSGALEATLVEDELAARLAWTYARGDGWVDNQYSGGDETGEYEDYALRLGLRYAPTERLDMVLKLAGSRSKMPSGYEVLATNIGAGGVGYFTGYDRRGMGFFDSELDRDSAMSIRNESTSFALTWDMTDVLSLVSVTAYDEGRWSTREDADGSPFNILHSDYGSEVRAYSQDIRLVSAFNGPANFVFGLYGHEEDLDAEVVVRTYYAFAGDSNGNEYNDCLEDFITGCRSSNRLNQTRSSLAAYFQGTYDISPELTATLGLRYTRDDNDLNDYNADVGYYDPASATEIISAIPTIRDYRNSVRDEKVNYRLVLDYALTQDVTSYASYTTGYRNSAFNGQAFYDASEITIAAPEDVVAWELGIKSEWWDRTLRVNGSAFHYRYRDQQFLDVTPQILQVLANADEARVLGAELEITKVFAPTLEVSAGLGLLDTEYTDITLRGEDLSGNQLINAPELTFNGRIDWTVAQFQQGNLELLLDAAFTGEQYFDAFNSDNARQDDYWVVNARLDFNASSGRWGGGLWVRNLTDEEYLTSLLDLQSYFNFDYAHRGPARTVGVDVRYEF